MENSINLPDKIKNHLLSVTKSSGLPDNNESLNLITQNWIDKDTMFDEQIKLLEMNIIDNFIKDDKRPVLLFTYSGSLISADSIENKKRTIEYNSIKLRSDVPDIVIMEDSNFSENASKDNEISFEKGQIKKTSAIYKIAVCDENVGIEEQNKRIREATIFLTNGFAKLNKTIFFKKGEVPDQFTMKSMIRYIADKNNISQKTVKQILEDYLYMVECGMLMKERVPLGRLGKAFLKIKPAQKARVGINPKNKEKITISAKPEMYVPKTNYSKNLKEKASTVKVNESK